MKLNERDIRHFVIEELMWFNVARKPRIEYAGGIYHVMNRGNHLESIYGDDLDRQIFLKTLEEACDSSGWVVHSFVLMENHYHLLVETLRPTLVKGMQYLNSTYTQRYNVRHKTRGHLFQGRYKALLIDPGDEERYFLTVSDYIHMNPVRIGKVKELKELLNDPWSSAGWLSGKRKGRPEWLRWERVYGELGMGNWRSGSRREFRKYLERRIKESSEEPEAWEKIRRGWCFGSVEFINGMKDRLGEMARHPRKKESWTGEAIEELEEDRAVRLLIQGCKIFGYKKTEDVQGYERYLLAKYIRSQSKVSIQWLADQFGLKTRGGMSHGIYLASQQIKSHKHLRKRYESLFV